MNDIDPQETREWLDALQAILVHDGEERAHFIIEQLINDARLAGVNLPFRNTTMKNDYQVIQKWSTAYVL